MHDRIRQIAISLAASAVVTVAAMAPSAIAAAPAPATNSAALALSCDRNCPYGVLDQYLAALARRDIPRVPWAPVVRNSENNVMLPVGYGLWGKKTKLGSYQLKMADPDTGEVGYFGAADENGAVSQFALRLKVAQKQVVEVETLVRRKADEANYMADPEFIDKPIFNEVIPAGSRLPRERLISIADGYFDTPQGKIRQVEAVFMTVPYRMPSPWMPED